MKTILYVCEDTGVIVEEETKVFSQFVTAKKYDVLYREELPGFRKDPLYAYGLPFFDKPVKRYIGPGRDGISAIDVMEVPKKNLSETQRALVKGILDDFSFAEQLMTEEASAKAFLNIVPDAQDYELIWLRISGDETPVPQGWQFAGYDISCLPNHSGTFSIICDCMFLCRWHGCDPEGTLFAEDFEKLNDDGLFDTWQDAYSYMVKYLSEDWTERGEFGIFEVYKAK